MVHATIIEQAASESLGQRCEADRDYYRRRAAQEAEAAGLASCCEARMAHEELAAAYRLLCSDRPGKYASHLATELAMFRFNPNPAD